MCRDAGLGKSQFAFVPPRDLKRFRQGIIEHNLKPAEKNAFFLTLRRLAERHGLLPNRLVIKEKIEVSDDILTSGGFGDVRRGRYKDRFVAVKTAKVNPKADREKIRKVSIGAFSHLPVARPQTSCPSDFTRRSFSGTDYPIQTS